MSAQLFQLLGQLERPGATELVIATGRPAAWQVVQKAAGNGPDGRPAPLVQIRRLSPVELPRPSEDGPLMVVQDGWPTPQELFPPRSPWQTTVYVLPYLHPQAGATANAADLVLLQRLPVGQAQLAARIWRLPPPMVHQLTTLTDEQVVALGRNLWRPLRLVPSWPRARRSTTPPSRSPTTPRWWRLRRRRRRR